MGKEGLPMCYSHPCGLYVVNFARVKIRRRFGPTEGKVTYMRSSTVNRCADPTVSPSPRCSIPTDPDRDTAEYRASVLTVIEVSSPNSFFVYIHRNNDSFLGMDTKIALGEGFLDCWLVFFM
jgi:hypothetical protein